MPKRHKALYQQPKAFPPDGATLRSTSYVRSSTGNRRPRPATPLLALPTRAPRSLKEYKGSPALDTGLLAAAQAVEHYEISQYGRRNWGLNDAVRLLDQTFHEEQKTDATLTKIAGAEVNQQAEVT